MQPTENLNIAAFDLMPSPDEVKSRLGLVSTKVAAKAVERLGGETSFVSLPIGHFAIYLGEWFERSSSAQVAFFTAALGKRQ